MLRPRHQRHPTVHVSAISLLVLCALGAVGPKAAAQEAHFEGRVSAEGGISVPGASVRLETQEGDLVLEVSTNSDGQFGFSGLRHTIYHLSVTAEGYEAYEQPVDLTSPASRHTVNVLLAVAKKGERAGSSHTLTDGLATKAARKEYEKGVRALQENKLDEARDDFGKAVAAYPCYARAQTALALGFISQHQLSPAEAALKKAVECDRDFLSAYLKLGELLNLERRFKESEPTLEEGLRRSPGLWKFFYQLGIAHYGLGEYSKAEEDFLKVRSLDPVPPADLHVKLADVYSKQGSYDKAYSEMQACLASEPNGRFAARIKAIMERMESSGVLHTPQSQAALPSSRP